MARPRICKVADHAEGTFWYVIPSLPMFLLMPWMIRKGISFPAALSAESPSLASFILS